MATSDLLDSNEIVIIMQENREARRNVFKDILMYYETYFRFVCTLDENIKYLVEKAQKDFAVFLNLDYQRIVDSIGYYLEYEDDENECE